MELEKIKTEKFAGLVSGLDYEVLSIEVFVNSDEIYPLERKLGINIDEILKEREEGFSILDTLAKKIDIYENHIYDSPTPSLLGGEFFAVRIEKKLIDYNLVVDCGLGLLKMSNGSYYLYNAHNDEYLFELMIGIYMMIVDEKYFSSFVRKVAKSEDGKNTVNNVVQVTKDFDLHQKLVEAIENKNGGDNIIYVDFGS